MCTRGPYVAEKLSRPKTFTMAEGPKGIAVVGEQLEEPYKKPFRKQGPYAPENRRRLGDINDIYKLLN